MRQSEKAAPRGPAIRGRPFQKGRPKTGIKESNFGNRRRTGSRRGRRTGAQGGRTSKERQHPNAEVAG
jgi:hypothetical protein